MLIKRQKNEMRLSKLHLKDQLMLNWLQRKNWMGNYRSLWKTWVETEEDSKDIRREYRHRQVETKLDNGFRNCQNVENYQRVWRKNVNQTEVLEETNKLKTAVTSILKVKENVNTTRKKFQKNMKGSKVEIKTEWLQFLIWSCQTLSQSLLTKTS